jgi:hypothetical protein
MPPSLNIGFSGSTMTIESVALLASRSRQWQFSLEKAHALDQIPCLAHTSA